MKKNTLKITWKPGSDFQDEFMSKSLKLILEAWKTHCKQSHKKNKILFEYEGESWQTKE